MCELGMGAFHDIITLEYLPLMVALAF